MMDQNRAHGFLGTAAAQLKEAAARARNRRLTMVAVTARLSERERIARELHDTILQGVQGLMLRLQVVAECVKNEPEQAARLIDQALARADAVLEEGRDRVRDLRYAHETPADLALSFLRVAKEAQPHPAKVRVTAEGAARKLRWPVNGEIEKIGTEAMVNALCHANASAIDVEIMFQRRQFVLRISDDGIGIDEAILNDGRERHFGLIGMRERARAIRGQVSFATRPGGGTEFELTIAAEFAFSAKEQWRPKWWRRRFASLRDRA